jgi:hypothetical protein
MSGELSIRLDSASFNRTMRALRGFDKKIYARTRTRLRAVSKPLVADVQAEIRRGGPSKTGMREGLADGTKATISLGKKAGVTIVTSPARLPAGKQPMARTWNKGSWRHPVFGDQSVWVAQTGHVFFAPTILKHRAELQRAQLAALQDAIREVDAAA